METPSSSAKLTNSSIQISRKIENSEKNLLKSKGQQQQQQQDRCALMDLTNDSPIVGLADDGNVETQSAKKQRESRVKNTPGSGEALLRWQTKTLLQKVEEEAFDLLSPATVTASVVIKQQPIHQMVNEVECESEKSVITRSLLMDFSEDSHVSEVSEEGSVVSSIKKLSVTTEDDNSSVWSMQVNAGDNEGEEEEYDEDEEITEDDENEEEEEEEEEEYEEGRLLLDELCEGLNNITVKERIVPKFEGKHTRFVYNSDDEVVKEEEESASPNILCLKGLPTPKGKHLRFSEEEE